MRRFTRFACIDWSGARDERLKGIAVAECAAGSDAPRLVRPADRRWSRADILAWLLDRADDDLLIGIDFSAALPFADAGAYFPGAPDSPADARALWRQVDEACRDDPHLAATSYVRDRAAWFRDGAVKGARFDSPVFANGRLRIVEQAEASGRPASCFNLVGARQVGRSSLTGMRVLHRLGGRVRIWPFDAVPPAGALIVEIYTAIAATHAHPRAGRSKFTTGADLDIALTSGAIASAPYGHRGPIDDHSSDAILTAAWLRRAAADARLWSPAGAAPVRDTEGWTFGVP
ncbi:MAG TPA: hypothetical protein VGC10_07745 [Sphingomonas sp.]